MTRSGEVHAWWLELDALDAPGRPQLATLSPAEHARAAAHRIPSQRNRYVHVRASLRSIAAGYLQTDPARIEITTREGGKPEFRGAAAALRFSVSHTETAAVIAFTTGRDVGVDVETVPAGLDLLAVASAQFDTDQVQALLAAPDAERSDSFLRSWARREALLKCVGTGIGHGLAGARCPGASLSTRLTSFTPASAPLPGGGLARDLHVVDLDAPPAHRAALAVRGAQAPAAVVVHGLVGSNPRGVGGSSRTGRGS